MLLGKRKNNHIIASYEPFPKRLKCCIFDCLLEIKHTLKKIKLNHDADVKINLYLNKNTNNIHSVLSIDDNVINPYHLDFY